MPFGSEGVEDGIGLALSGGGFRATLFHIGTLHRLNELGVLGKLDRVSSVSGGSIAAGLLAQEWNNLTFQGDVATNLDTLVFDRLRAFCRLSIDAPAVGEGVLLPWRSVSEAIQDSYEEHLFGKTTLSALPDRPCFVFNTTNLKTGRNFRFSKPYMGDYRIGLIWNPAVRLSLAVTASSAFPPVLSPVVMKDLPPFEAVKGADLAGNPNYTTELYLTDGGAYDNLGLETVWNRYRTLLVSDAGAPFAIDDKVQTDWLWQTRRALDVATDQSRALRKRALIGDYTTKDSDGRTLRDGAYWGITSKIKNYDLASSMNCRDDLVQPLAKIRTRLNPFTEDEQGRLINWGYALADTAIRKHASHLAVGAAHPSSWPCPDQALGSL